MIKAAITPGTHPNKVRISTIRIDPQPLSITARGGKRIDNITLHILITATKILNSGAMKMRLITSKKQLIGSPIVCIFASQILKFIKCIYLNRNKFAGKNWIPCEN
jgi:hypothetical protein